MSWERCSRTQQFFFFFFYYLVQLYWYTTRYVCCHCPLWLSNDQTVKSAVPKARRVSTAAYKRKRKNFLFISPATLFQEWQITFDPQIRLQPWKNMFPTNTRWPSENPISGKVFYTNLFLKKQRFTLTLYTTVQEYLQFSLFDTVLCRC